ncbi:MAG: DUF4386 domain-containing protein [Thermoanaerobaculia bacterium]
MHSRGYSVTGVFFGVYCVLIGYLVFRSGFLPRAVGMLMAIGGLAYVTQQLHALSGACARRPAFPTRLFSAELRSSHSPYGWS